MRSLLTSSHRYVYAPHSARERSNTNAAQLTAHHPAASALEQLYDLQGDPTEQAELIGKFQLLFTPATEAAAPIQGSAATRASNAFSRLRAEMQSDLRRLAAMCGVD